MPHQCVRCGSLYGDGDGHILTGCDCGSKLFYFVRQDKLAKLKEEDKTLKELSPKEQEKVEKDIYDIVGDSQNPNEPIILDIESVKVSKPGSYELDLVTLFNKKNPLVYRMEEGKYMIDISNSMKRRFDNFKDKLKKK